MSTTTATATDLTTATPVEVDTALAEIQVRLYTAMNRAEGAADTLRHYEKEEAKRPGLYGASVKRALENLEAAVAVVDALHAEAEPFHAEYKRRPWTRAWKVTNVGGHIHSSMYCSTCFDTTQYAWLPQVSGMPEAEIVALAASAACTICYPSAPVDKPTQLFTAAERDAQAEREARAAAKLAREAKKLEKALMPDGQPLLLGEGRLTSKGTRVWGYDERIETLHAARGWLTDAYWWMQARGSHPSYPHDHLVLVVAAVAAKEGKTESQVMEEAQKRAAKRK